MKNNNLFLETLYSLAIVVSIGLGHCMADESPLSVFEPIPVSLQKTDIHIISGKLFFAKIGDSIYVEDNFVLQNSGPATELSIVFPALALEQTPESQEGDLLPDRYGEPILRDFKVNIGNVKAPVTFLGMKSLEEMGFDRFRYGFLCKVNFPSRASIHLRNVFNFYFSDFWGIMDETDGKRAECYILNFLLNAGANWVGKMEALKVKMDFEGFLQEDQTDKYWVIDPSGYSLGTGTIKWKFKNVKRKLELTVKIPKAKD